MPNGENSNKFGKERKKTIQKWTEMKSECPQGEESVAKH